VSSAAPGTAEVWWLGQGSFVFTGPKSGTLVVDPYLSDSVEKQGGPKRLHPVPVAPTDLHVSGIFLTHDHTDHTDPDTLPALCAANPDAPIYAVPESVAHLQRLGITGPRVNRLERGQTVYGDGYHVHAVPAKHTDDSVGLVFVFDDGPCIYHTADTEYFEGIEDAHEWGITLLCICINGRWGNMGIEDAVRVTTAIRPRYVLPMHWGLFAENTADPNEFTRKLAASGIPVETILLKPDGTARYTAPAGA
jgi:L-ascorbate metabolism protein UlaG (beta-lactamase superfamily)